MKRDYSPQVSLSLSSMRISSLLIFLCSFAPWRETVDLSATVQRTQRTQLEFTTSPENLPLSFRLSFSRVSISIDTRIARG